MLNPKQLPTVNCGWIVLAVILVPGILSRPLFAGSKVKDLVESMSLEQLMTLKAGSTSFFDTMLEETPGSLYNSRISTPQKEPAPGSSSEDIFSCHRFVVNTAARYKLSETLTLTLRGKNILDNDVPAAGYYYNWGYGKDNTAFTRPEVYIGLNWKF